MATKKKKIEEELVEEEKIEELAKEEPVIEEKIEEPIIKEEPIVKEKKIEKTEEPIIKEKKSKFKIGDIVFISKEAEADLNGFKLFPPYKKGAYTVEAHDAKSGVYSLRRLNLLLALPEKFILAPDERAHDSVNRIQF